MFKQIIEKIIMGTQTYKKLKEEYLTAKEFIKEVKSQCGKTKTEISAISTAVKEDKTIARKIVRLINKGLDKKNETVVEVKALCNEIINRK